MGDTNPICTLGDYSRPSHEGHMITIELPVGNNVVPFRSDTIRLVQNRCSFHGLWSEDPNQNLKDFIKLMDLLDLDGYVQLNFSNPLSFWKSTFGFKPGKRASRNVRSQRDDENSPTTQSTPHNWPTIRNYGPTKEDNPPPLEKSHWKKRSEDSECSKMRYDPKHNGIKCRLGGEPREISLLELGRRVELYTERRSRDNATLNGLSKAETVKANRLLMEFWPTIRDGGFNVGNTMVASIRDPRVKLAHRCIETTIAGRKETTYRVTEIDLYYLYCIYTLEVACNILYWLSKYLKGVRDKNLIYEGMFVTRIARSFGLFTNKLRDALSSEHPPHVFKKKSLISMSVIMKLQMGYAFGLQHERSRRRMKPRKRLEGTRVMKGLEVPSTWQQDEGANWMYAHTVRQFQHMSTCDNLDPHLQIDPFPGHEANYPPYGYTGHMPPGYEYRFGPAPGSSKFYLIRRSLKVLRKFHWTILEGRFNQLSHVSSPLLSKQGEY
nr:putative retrotransposon Orf1 [Tanacetum cinerariifolium]